MRREKSGGETAKRVLKIHPSLNFTPACVRAQAQQQQQLVPSQLNPVGFPTDLLLLVVVANPDPSQICIWLDGEGCWWLMVWLLVAKCFCFVLLCFVAKSAVKTFTFGFDPPTTYSN